MSFKTLLAYQKGFALAMEIFEVSKTFPKEERYSLTVKYDGPHAVYLQILQNLIEKDLIQDNTLVN